MQAIATARRVAVRSGHKVGKSRLAVAIALWWWDSKPGARVVLTAPTGRQVRKILWRELRMLHRSSPRPLGGAMARTPDGGLVADDGRDIFGFSADKGETFSGVSGENVLYIVDEASGVEDRIFEAIEGNRAGGASLLLLGNPTQTVGQFKRAFTEERAAWATFHISSREAAAYQREHGTVPGLATDEWIEEKRRDGWEGTALWDVRVEGDFPREGSNNVIGLALVEAARQRWDVAEPPNAGVLRLGVDPARFGDDEAAVSAVRGTYAFPPDTFRGLDGPQLAARVLSIVRHRRRSKDERPRVKVDVIGIGASCFDSLAREKEVEAIAINVSERATSEPVPPEPGFSRLRDQIWFATRDWLRDGGMLPPDPKLEADLVAPVYGFDPSGKYRVESKDELKRRLGRSPDRGDGLGLAVYEPVIEETVGDRWARLLP